MIFIYTYLQFLFIYLNTKETLKINIKYTQFQQGNRHIKLKATIYVTCERKRKRNFAILQEPFKQKKIS